MELDCTFPTQRNRFGLIVALLAAALWFPALARAGGIVSTPSEAALNTALSGGGIVTFACDGLITVTSTKSIQQDTTIDATGHNIVISGGGAVQVFSVSGTWLNLVNLTVANGKAAGGGAVYVGGGLVASYCNFTNNVAQGTVGSFGGNGVNGSDGGNGGVGGSGLGGAIYNEGTVLVTNCVFSYNSAVGGTGGQGGNGGSNNLGNGGDGGRGGAGGVSYGGALYSSAYNVTAINCTVAGNTVVGGDGGAGGAAGTGSPYSGMAGDGGKGGEGCGAGFYVAAPAILANCSFYGNVAQGGSSAAALGSNPTGTTGDNGAAGGNGLGGGLCNRANSSTVLNCTFYANAAAGGNGGNGSSNDDYTGGDGGPGGKGSGGGIYSTNVIQVTNCTFSTNAVYGGAGGAAGYGPGVMGSAGSAGVVQGANIANGSGTFTLKNSIIAYKKNDGNGYGTITDQGNNISSDASITLNGSGSHSSTDPKLAPLAYNGGPTATCALNTGSPAINGGDDSAAPVLDQRGYTRPDGSDIGAYEYGAVYDFPLVAVYTTNSVAIEGCSVSAFIFDRGSTNSVPKTVLYTLSGTASNGVDYVALTNKVVIPAGEQTVTNVLTPMYRGTNDGSKTVVVTLVQDSGPSYALSTYSNATVSILDDYPVVDVYATNSIAVEGQSVSAFVLFRETYYTSGGSPKTIYYSLSGTATNGVHYATTSTSAVIPANQPTTTIPITPIFNAALDGTRTVTLTLLAGTNYATGTSNATIGLLDGAPIISATAPWSYAFGTNYWGLFSITRSGGLSQSLTVSYAVSGTAQPGSGYTALPGAVTFATNQTFTNLLVAPTVDPSSAETVVLTLSSNADYFLAANSQAVVTLLPASSATNSVSSPVGRYWRGSGSNPAYWSIVVPLSYEKGTRYDDVFGNCPSLYPGLSSWTNDLRYHYDATNDLAQSQATNRLAFNNPIAAFGERVGGSALYLNQDYSFGVYAGYPVPMPVIIQVFARSNYALVGTINLYPPNLDDTNSWNNYTGNGFQVTTNAFGLSTTLSDSPTMDWGSLSFGYELTHAAGPLATNYYYLVSMSGYYPDTNSPLAIDASGAIASSMLYTLEFEAQPPWRAVFIDQPHFDGSPLPPFYAGKTVEEMLTNTLPVTNTVSLSPTDCTNLDDSPELRRHPLLDQFVADMGNDPVALANYVLNQIDLTDPMDFNDGGNVAEESINEGGVSRGALGVFLEKQGSPTEQCALLIYLLRQAGVPAAYVYPPHNGMKILDARLSRMLKFQVHGGFSEAGNAYTTNTMIAVNYPWVAAYIGTNWVNIFPWLKDYEINEGLDLYSYMPTNYTSAYPWVHDYVYGASNLLSLAQDGDNTPRVIFPKFLAQTLVQNHPGISVDDLGVQIVNRRHYYARWQDFPTPTWVTNTSITVSSLSDSAITNVSPLLTNVFNTLSVEVYSVNDPTKDIRTGDLRLVDLHNRQFYITQSNSSPTQTQLSLILAAFRTNTIVITAVTDTNRIYATHFSSGDYDSGISGAANGVYTWTSSTNALTNSYGRIYWNGGYWFLQRWGYAHYLDAAGSSSVLTAANIWANPVDDYVSPGQTVFGTNYVTNNLVTPGTFSSSDTNLLGRQSLSLTLDQFDDPLQIRLKYYRHHAITPSYGIDPRVTFLGFGGGTQTIVERPLRKGDLAALCLCYGRVTRDMLNVHEQDLWDMQSALRANPAATNSLSTDTYQGALMTVCGMQYYRRTSDFDAVNRNLHKTTTLSSWAMGLSKISPSRDSYGNLANGSVDPVLPNVDMFFYRVAAAGNGTLRPDSGQNYQAAEQNYGLMWIADLSAEEHQAINDFYQQTNAVSTVRLLQLAESQGYGIVPLNINNYQAQAQVVYQGQALQSFDPDLWQQITTAFQNSSGYYVTGYITPGPMTNSAYKGMAALVLDWGEWQALITPGGLNGAYGENLPDLSVAAPNAPNWNSGVSSDGDLSINVVNSASIALPPSEVPNYNVLATDNQIASGQFTIDPFSQLSSSSASLVLSLNQQSSLNLDVAQTFLTVQQNGNDGPPNDGGSQWLARIADPVNNITGEFYVDETDLLLPGPIPLAMRRNYSSQNLADNQFGPGWKLSLMPYLTVSQGATNIYAADMDGAVLAYVQTATNATVWLPSLSANPQLNNNTTVGAGGLVNRLRDRLVQTVNGSTTNYTLYGADGSLRTFQVTNFDNGIINQTRPYLQEWTDNRGNFYTFSYGTDPSQTDFAQVRRIQCSNGNYLGFYYDIYGHIVEAYSGDGRRLEYEFDQFGDLVTVTLPDASTRSYVYQHSTQSVTNGSVVSQQPYSTHLIVEEDKPDGRALINAYDDQRRVTNQLSTAGVDLNPVRTATFIYLNNFNLTNSYTNTVTGYTLLIDGRNYTNRFDYTNSLITQVTDPLGQTLQQSWYADNTSPPGYPRSVSTRTDKRGLVTQLFYDSNGNVTNTIVTGDLTGDGITSQSATNTASYNTNCLPLQMIDPAGNSTFFVYDPVFAFLPQQVIRYAGTTAVSTSLSVHGSVTNVVTLGSLLQTNLALGLPVRQIRAYGSSDAATNDLAYNGQGFLTQSVRYTGTADPAVTNTFFYNERGEMVDQVDALGADVHSEFDDMGRLIERDNFDEYGNLLAWTFNYYNDNGELVWTEGPRYNPEDYVWRDYDGAGRLSTEIHWRAEAKADGTGVQAPSGYNLYAQSFYQYDVMGNLTLAVDPRGATSTNQWDALGRVVQRWRTDLDGATVLSHEGFAYEPGGQVRFQTNALGGLIETEYTTTGQPEYRRDADGSTNAWRYYLDGRLRREIQNNGAYWETTYDDANRKSTRTFYTASATALATNSTTLDRRGNPVQRVDAAFNVFTNLFDGLDRPKVTAGPATTTVSISIDFTPVTNVLQQVSTSFYDAANRVLTVTNALGEKTVTTRDALGRQTSVQTFASGASTPLRVTTYTYSPDHHSVTVTQGSGTNAVVSTTFTDNDRRKLLAVGYPSSGVTEFTLDQYDLAGNLIHEEHDSSSGGTPTVWTKADYVLDGLNRVVQATDRDGAVTTFGLDAANNPTSRLMPGGLKWKAVYNSAGQELQDWVAGTDGSGTQTNLYAYYSGGGPNAGLLQMHTDGRGSVATYTYDLWLRLTNLVRTIGSPYGQLTTTWAYDVRGLATNITEMNAGDSGGPDPKVVARTFDAYGQMSSETITLNGTILSSSAQGWDVAGRRTLLSLNSQVSTLDYAYGWRADGLLGSVSTFAGGALYGYSTSGLLDSRQVGDRSTQVTSRDGRGRPLAVTTTVNTEQELSETLAWTGDGLLGTHVLYRGDFTDERDYSYATLSRRLTEERVSLDAASRWTNVFAYDHGASAGIGLLTSAGAPGSGGAAWSAGFSPLLRINTETNTLARQTAYGRFNGQASVSASLDGHPLPVSVNGVPDSAWTNRWSTTMELSPGAHQLSVTALHPSGFFSTNASVWFTNNLGAEADQIYRNGVGEITRRVWTKPGGSTSHSQNLTWDGKGRLCQVFDSDAQGNGFYWVAEYDALDRLLCTKWYVETNDWAQINGVVAQTNRFLYDPQVPFLDLGVYVGPSGQDDNPGEMTWKLCGPDSNGRYGGLNGAGGLDAVATGAQSFSATINDARGNVLGVYDPSDESVDWSASRPTGYGAVPGYQPLPLGHGGSYVESAAWHGKWADVTGYVWLARRFYDPAAGMWLSPDPAWNPRDPSYWSYCGDDPINSFDGDGRCAKAVGNYLFNTGSVGQEFRDVSSILNYIGDNTISPTLGALTAFGSYFTDRGANNATPSTYVNQAVSDYNAAGGGIVGVLGVGNRYNPTASAYDFASGYDLISGQQLSSVDRASAGLNTVGGALLLGAGVADSFTPGTAPTPTTSFYRVVSEPEHQSLMETGEFSAPPSGGSTPIPGQPGKWFWGSQQEAEEFAPEWYGSEPYKIIETKIPSSTTPASVQPGIDNVGTGYFFKMQDLQGVPIKTVK